MALIEPTIRKHPSIFQIFDEHCQQQQAAKHRVLFALEILICFDHCVDETTVSRLVSLGQLDNLPGRPKTSRR